MGNQATPPPNNEEHYAEQAEAGPHGQHQAQHPQSAPAARQAASGLFTQAPAQLEAAPIPAPAQPHRPSIFNLVTGALRRGPAQPAQPEMPDMRDVRRSEPHFAGEQQAPSATVRAHAEAEPAGLDIPAFLRRQSS